jgi:hypothetical protein
MNDLVEVRGTNVAFEIRNGVKVEFAAGDRETRMRSLGCPETILKRMRTHQRTAKKSAPARPFTEKELAEINGCTVEQFRARADYERVHRATQLGREIARQQDADLRARADSASVAIAADAEQMRKDEELLSHMQDRAGISAGKRRTL